MSAASVGFNADVEFELLGNVCGRAGGQPVHLGARKQRLVLALLALEMNRLVPVSRLVELIWADRPPASARGMIHTYVSGLRAVLDAHGGGCSLAGAAAAYELRGDPLKVDAHRFRHLLAAARAEPDPAARLHVLDEALALWHGPALSGVTVEATRVRLCRHLEEARLVAIEDRASALLGLDRHDEVADDLIPVAENHPNRQRLAARLILALHRGGRTAEALRLYERTRRGLADELGLDPGDELERLHRALLRGTQAPA